MATEPLTAEGHGKTHSPLPVLDRRGQEYCFNCIIETFESLAYNLAARIVGDRTQAEDCMQEAMLSVYRAFGSFRGENLRAWFLRIVANSCRAPSGRKRPDHPYPWTL